MSLPNMYQPPTHYQDDQEESESGYSLFFFSPSRPWTLGLLVALLVCGGSIAFYIWFKQTHDGIDVQPFGPVALVFATAGTIFMILAGVMFTLRRRVRKKEVGQLNASLNWHMFFAIIALVLLFLHAFGQFEPISGTYALEGLIALSISGLIGRMLDRLLPRLIASEVQTALTAQGEDRVEKITKNLREIVKYNLSEGSYGFSINNKGNPTVKNQGAAPGKNAPTVNIPWDMAYLTLEPTQQELDRNAPQYRFIPDEKSRLTEPGALMPGALEEMSALEEVQGAIRRERFYRYIIRYWRVFHIGLALVTTGLVIWHLIYVSTILPGLYGH